MVITHLNCHLFASLLVHTELDLAEMPCAERVTDLVLCGDRRGHSLRYHRVRVHHLRREGRKSSTLLLHMMSKVIKKSSGEKIISPRSNI